MVALVVPRCKNSLLPPIQIGSKATPLPISATPPDKYILSHSAYEQAVLSQHNHYKDLTGMPMFTAQQSCCSSRMGPPHKWAFFAASNPQCELPVRHTQANANQRGHNHPTGWQQCHWWYLPGGHKHTIVNQQHKHNVSLPADITEARAHV